MSSYPLFAPPDELAAKGRENWSRAEADYYRQWLLNEIDTRIGHLLGRLGESNPIDMLRIGHKAAALLRTPEFSSNGKLTDAGYSLAADLGLLVARELLNRCPTVKWKTVRGPKNDAAYNMPVLHGFGKVDLDPIGGSIGEAFGVLTGRRDADTWMNILEHWSNRAK